MALIIPRRLRDKVWPEPLPPLTSFEGQTVLLTGATGGLGLAAAVHFATLGGKVIMTARNLSQSDSVRDYVEQHAGIVGQGKIHIMELDMSQYSSCVSFVEQLKQSEAGRTGIDVAVLNAGVINVDFVRSPEGWEQTIQVNALSTTLLGLLLIQWMSQTSKNSILAPHLIFVTSRDHLDPNITTWPEWSSQEGLLQHFSDERNWPSGGFDPNYANSKLLLTYAVEEICKRAVGPNGTVDVIVNTVCPGLVYTDLGRSIAKMSRLMQLLVPIHTGILGKSADYGARFYVKAARTSKHEHGKYIQSLFTDEEYRSLAIPNLMTDTAMKVKALVWNEIITELKEKVPALRDLKDIS
ncbi:NAD(P)-binding protein [Penicillium fimorum]|uniref:NAD(P)-binding protein n=1 Tax=Penicillium fimorum TaxID=1882269 RepID=A0A9W9XP71_9EURO|nr:NAD(P)-binding protein [Penicillium fimorum]